MCYVNPFEPLPGGKNVIKTDNEDLNIAKRQKESKKVSSLDRINGEFESSILLLKTNKLRFYSSSMVLSSW
jgi:hypothetical protein